MPRLTQCVRGLVRCISNPTPVAKERCLVCISMHTERAAVLGKTGHIFSAYRGQVRSYGGFFGVCSQALTAAAHVIGTKAIDYGLDKLLKKTEVFLYGEQPDPATKEQVEAVQKQVETALTTLTKLDQQSDEMQALQIMQVAAPIMRQVCGALADLAVRRPDLHVNQIVMCNEEVSSVIPKLLLAFESVGLPCSSRRPVVGDRVSSSKRSVCSKNPDFRLGSGEVATVIAVDADGDIKLRDPRGFEQGGFFYAREFVYANAEPPSACRVEIEHMAKTYVKAVAAAVDFTSEYNQKGQLARWWSQSETIEKIDKMKDTYSAFMQAFQFVLQVDTRIALDHGFKDMRARFDKLEISIADFSRAGSLINGKVDDMSHKVDNMGKSAEQIRGDQQGMRQQMSQDNKILTEGVNFLIKENSEMKLAMIQTLTCLTDIAKTQDQNVKQLITQNGEILKTLNTVVEQNSRLLEERSRSQ